MLILEHDVLEVITLSFMEHLEPAINGETQKLSNKNLGSRSSWFLMIIFKRASVCCPK